MHINSDEAMQKLGEEIAHKLKGGETIELIGDVGAGKTTLVHGLSRGLGLKDAIQSPTFTISREYTREDGLVLKHYDFYRLDNPGIMADEIREASNDPHSIVIVEWASSVSEVLPSHRVVINIKSDPKDPDGRLVEVLGVNL